MKASVARIAQHRFEEGREGNGPHSSQSRLLRYDNIDGMPVTLELSSNSVIFRASKLKPFKQRLTARKLIKDFEF